MVEENVVKHRQRRRKRLAKAPAPPSRGGSLRNCSQPSGKFRIASYQSGLTPPKANYTLGDMRFSKPVLVSLCSCFCASLLLATPSWEQLGGSFQGKPCGVLGRVFVRGTDNALWFTVQTSPGNWAPFVSLGGIITSNPTAVQDTTGRIAVFALGTDGAVWTRAQITAGIDNYSDWTSLGGYATSDVAVVQRYPQEKAPFSTAYLFVRGGDNALWYNRTSDASAPWGQWMSLGGYLTSAPAAGLNRNNEASVFVRGGDNALWYRIGFNDWGTLGGAMNGPAGAAEINNRYIVYRGMDNAAWSILDTTPPPCCSNTNVAPATWSDPASLGGYLISNPTMADRIFPTTDDPEVFAVGGDHALWVTVSPGSGSPFGPWQSLGGYIVGDPFPCAMRTA